MGANKSAIQSLGEIALRVNDLDAMQRFYQDVVGLELMKRFSGSAFFRIADGYGGHSQILALFDRSEEIPGLSLRSDQSTLDHIAFEIDRNDYEPEKKRLEGLGVKLTLRTFEWVHWRSLFFNDPEGNRVEFVCYDESV